jgi:Flp pilus assembly protein TadD
LLRSLRVRPNFAPAHALLGKLYLREDNAARALEELRTALRLQPSNRAAMNQMALALRRLGRLEESRAMAERLRRQYEEDLKAESARVRVRIEKQ